MADKPLDPLDPAVVDDLGRPHLSVLYRDSQIGLNSKAAFIKRLKTAGALKYYTKKEIDDFFKGQEKTLYAKRPPKISERMQILATGSEIGQYQMDLVDWSKWHKSNFGFKFILTCVDIYSRKAWAIPLKNKEGKTVAAAARKILEQTKDKPYRSVITDYGSEFKDKNFVALCKELGYIQKMVDPAAINAKSKVGIVERFNLTLVTWLKKYMYHNDTTMYSTQLEKFIESYNDTEHSTTKESPDDVWSGKKKSRQEIRPVAALFPKYSVGQKVHYLVKRKTFDKKGFMLNYSDTAVPVKRFVSPKYELENGLWFYERELIPEVSKEKTKSGKIKIAALQKDVHDENKFESGLKKELGIPIHKFDKVVKDTKRVSKPVIRLGHSKSAS